MAANEAAAAGNERGFRVIKHGSSQFCAAMTPIIFR
jgi:hypothetical protein